MRKYRRARPHRRLPRDSFLSRKVENLICAIRHPTCTGSWNGRTGDGEVFGQRGMRCPWAFERTIKRGQWTGPWRRVRWEEDEG